MLEAHPLSLLRWIPALPLAAALVHGVLLGLLRRPLPRSATVMFSCGAVAASFLLSSIAFVELVTLPEGDHHLVDNVFTWIGSRDFSAEVAFLLDPLSAVMCLVVTGVGLLIHVYSVGYMEEDDREDRGFARFFCYLNLFTFSMLVLVLADNLVLTFLGWEGVGLCSYLLIGFWYADDWNARCGTKAFIVNRIGDVGFLVGIFLLFWSLHTAAVAAAYDGPISVAYLDLQTTLPLILEQTVAVPSSLAQLSSAFGGELVGTEWKLVSIIGFCFFVAAAGKSAQLPLYVWLPDAMAGPTPVSALIHAATMVTAGVYLVCRLSFLYAAAPGASAIVAWVGAGTALFAAVIAIAQTDIKKVLAYSTVSQLGYMFLAAGCGAYSAAMFHVVTHAFFKALLFLGAGAVILALHHEQDTDRMGGLREALPWTHWTFLLGVLAIAGIPPLSGFWSKDEILLSAYLAHVPGHRALYGIALGTAGLTAFYMFRLYFRIFWGRPRGAARDGVHEPDQWVVLPLVVLAVLSVFGGLLGPSEAFVPIENANSFANFLAPILTGMPHEVEHATERGLAFAATAVSLAGVALAAWLYVTRPGIPGAIRRRIGFLHRLVEQRFYVDEAIDAVLVQPLIRFSDRILHRGIDAGLIDGLAVNGTAHLVRDLATGALKQLQTGFAQSYLFVMAAGAAAIVLWLVSRGMTWS